MAPEPKTGQPAYRLLLLLLLLLKLTPAAHCFSPAEAADINQCVELAINHHYLEAIALFSGRLEDSLAYENASSAALAHFHIATVYAAWMQDREDYARSDSYEYHLARTEQITDSLLLVEEDADLLFLRAGCSLYRSYLAKRRGQWWRMYLQGIDGVNRLENLAAGYPDYREVDLGLGNYLYWKSSLLQNLTWVPFIDDQRAEGIARLERAATTGQFGRWLAVSNLTWIMMDYGQPEAALAWALRGREQFPDSRHFLFPLAQAQRQRGELAAADSLYSLLLEQLQADQQPSHYNEFYCLNKMVWINRELEHWPRALALRDSALALPLTTAARERLRKKISQLELLPPSRRTEQP
ncbi:MAG: hypothetical protein ISR91_01145 [Candidatus Delongbacteria bacterium]|nr:hypothetical protein [bacterium]MBL7032726.1 hypothetical protein [Candidatus Delongbacteria bacterium]